jgi:hypothetical protein
MIARLIAIGLLLSMTTALIACGGGGDTAPADEAPATESPAASPSS